LVHSLNERDDGGSSPDLDGIEIEREIAVPGSGQGMRVMLPGQKVIPTRPRSGPAEIAAILIGWVSEVFFMP
jgi:hypothetical protein